MKKLLPFGVLVLLVAGGLAFAAASIDYRDSVQFMRAGLWVLPSSLNAQATTANKVTRMHNCGGRVDYDFPAIGPGGTGQAGGHLLSNAIPCTGALLGDDCHVKSTGGDGGILPDLFLSCYVSAANTVRIQANAMLDDAGTLDPSDAGHYIYIRSAQ